MLFPFFKELTEAKHMMVVHFLSLIFAGHQRTLPKTPMSIEMKCCSQLYNLIENHSEQRFRAEIRGSCACWFFLFISEA